MRVTTPERSERAVGVDRVSNMHYSYTSLRTYSVVAKMKYLCPAVLDVKSCGVGPKLVPSPLIIRRSSMISFMKNTLEPYDSRVS